MIDAGSRRLEGIIGLLGDWDFDDAGQNYREDGPAPSRARRNPVLSWFDLGARRVLAPLRSAPIALVRPPVRAPGF